MHWQSDAAPVFVVGMNGSGTTLLLDCLDSHPELFGFRRETRVLPYFLSRLASYGALEDDGNFRRLWDDFRKVPDFVHVNGGEPPPLPADWQTMPREFAAIVDSVFRHFASQANKQRWCEKTPMHALHIQDLSTLFPKASFIHIIRDGRACAASFHRRWKHTPQLTMYRWKNVVREAQRQGRQPGIRYHELKYESLVADAGHEMRRICEFLDVPFVDEVLSPSQVRPVTTGSADLAIVPRQERWRSAYTPAELLELERIGGRALADLGYETDTPDGDRDPSKLVRKLWLYRDYLRITLTELIDIARGGSNKSLQALYGRIVGAVRQRFTTKY